MRDEVLVPGSAAKVTAKVEQKRKKINEHYRGTAKTPL